MVKLVGSNQSSNWIWGERFSSDYVWLLFYSNNFSTNKLVHYRPPKKNMCSSHMNNLEHLSFENGFLTNFEDKLRVSSSHIKDEHNYSLIAWDAKPLPVTLEGDGQYGSLAKCFMILVVTSKHHGGFARQTIWKIIFEITNISNSAGDLFGMVQFVTLLLKGSMPVFSGSGLAHFCSSNRNFTTQIHLPSV